MSVPAAKALSPAPVMISAFTAGSAAIASQQVISPWYIAKVSALRACGRLRDDPGDPGLVGGEQQLVGGGRGTHRRSSGVQATVSRTTPRSIRPSISEAV